MAGQTRGYRRCTPQDGSRHRRTLTTVPSESNRQRHSRAARTRRIALADEVASVVGRYLTCIERAAARAHVLVLQAREFEPLRRAGVEAFLDCHPATSRRAAGEEGRAGRLRRTSDCLPAVDRLEEAHLGDWLSRGWGATARDWSRACRTRLDRVAARELREP